MADLTIAALLEAVEREWERLEAMEAAYPYVDLSWAKPVLDASRKLNVVLRAARKSGAVPVLLSRESIEALLDVQLACLASSTSQVSIAPGSFMDRLMVALDRDLAEVLKAEVFKEDKTC